ncbi:androgen-dependent TFPI-regulating protein [Manduca sexta]|uniref:androgen-dependent TFPI-regulating protein n=1 Tax=Manduca sexta TaxID=7130 RepID=UPI00188FF47D|nr:androgen-dependent TFPI-regulating protein [Manduca sexta]
MPSLIQLRIMGHTAALAMHLVNSAVMFRQMMGDIVKMDKEVRSMVSLQGQYLTVWNIGFQMFYSSLALGCDLLTVMKKDNMLPKFVIKFRSKFFETIVFPGTVLIFLLFWPIYLYDRSLIFPEFIDRIFSQKSNLVMHLGILPVVLWELVLLPRTTPKSHKLNIKILTAYYTAYNIVLLYTYAQRGLWPYPLFGLIYGTIYFPLFLINLFFLTLLAYYSQWPVNSFLWESKKLNVKEQ